MKNLSRAMIVILGMIPFGACVTDPFSQAPLAYSHPSSEGGGGGYYNGPPARYSAQGYGYSAEQVRPRNQWVPHCKGGYDKCGRDGIVHRGDSNPQGGW